MKYRFAADCHTHSNCSFDGHSSMEDMCRQAEKLGLSYYTVSDHCECNKFETAQGHPTGYRKVAQKAWEQMKICEGNNLEARFLKGVELGQPLQNLNAAREVLSRDYDFVLGSLHNVEGEKDFYHLGKNGLSSQRREELFHRYFSELLSMINWGNFDSLAHISYPLRYLSAPGEASSLAPYLEELSEVLAALVKAEKALEMNTSRLCQTGLPRLPDLEIFSLYRRLGGRLVTLGSDAHSAGDLAQGIDQGMDILKQAGFTEFAVYVKRKPRMLPLE